MNKWFQNIVSYVTGSNLTPRNNSNTNSHPMEADDLETGGNNNVTRYTVFPNSNNSTPRSSTHNLSTNQQQTKSRRRRRSSSSDCPNGEPLLPVIAKDVVDKELLGAFDPRVTAPSIKTRHHRHRNNKKEKAKRADKHAAKSRKPPILAGLECSRPVAGERCFLIKYQKQIYYVFHRTESTVFKKLLALIESRLSELHRLRPLYWPVDTYQDGTKSKEPYIPILFTKIMAAEFETLRNLNTLQSTLLNFAINAAPNVPYTSEMRALTSPPTSPESPALEAPWFNQTRLESMMPAAGYVNSISHGSHDTVHKRHNMHHQAYQTYMSNFTDRAVADDETAIPIDLNSAPSHHILLDDEDSGDGKIHKNRVIQKKQKNQAHERETALRHFPKQIQKFVALSREKKIAVIKEMESKRRSHRDGKRRVVLRNGIGGDDLKSNDLDILLDGMKALVDDSGSYSSGESRDDDDDDASASSSDSSSYSGSGSSSSSFSSSSSSSSSAATPDALSSSPSAVHLQPVWLETVCDTMATQDNLVSSEIRTWYRHNYQIALSSWVVVDATLGYILLHQSGAAAEDLGFNVK